MTTRLLLLAMVVSLPAPALAQQGALRCGGTEPFWDVTHTGSEMWLSTPEVRRLELVPVSARKAEGRPQDLLRVYETRRANGRGADARGGVTLVVTRNRETCSDGMSDRRYPYDAVYIDAERVLVGCCSWTR